MKRNLQNSHDAGSLSIFKSGNVITTALTNCVQDVTEGNEFHEYPIK